MDPSDEELIRSKMDRPKTTTVDGTTNTQHSLTETLDAQERLAASKANRRPGRALKNMFVKLRFPGAS